MTTRINERPDGDGIAQASLEGYFAAVCAEVGISPKSGWCEVERPSNAYLAVDEHDPSHPDHDLALMWDEENGWAAVAETNAAHDIQVLRYLGGQVVPEPRVVGEFLADVAAGRQCGSPDPPRLRSCVAEDDLPSQLVRYLGRE